MCQENSSGTPLCPHVRKSVVDADVVTYPGNTDALLPSLPHLEEGVGQELELEQQ